MFSGMNTGDRENVVLDLSTVGLKISAKMSTSRFSYPALDSGHCQWLLLHSAFGNWL